MIFKKFSYIRTLEADHKYEISNIIIFDPKNAEKIYESNTGWLEIERKDTIWFELPKCKRKIKFDLNIKHPFIIKDINKSYFNKIRNPYILYIPSNEVNLKFIKEDVVYNTNTIITYGKYYEFDLFCKMTDETECSTHKFLVCNITKSKRTDFGYELKFWEEKLKEEGINILSYDLEKFLKKYKLLERV